MKINGVMFRDMVVSAANELYNCRTDINDLNVFPVPDGDTGDNMSMTMSTVRHNLDNFEGNISECAHKVSSLVLRSARGNSGVILSLFFRGMAHSLKGVEEADSIDIAKAFQKGVSEAYKAVMNPTEGTILTVMRICAEKACAVAQEKYSGDVGGLFEYMYKVSVDTLKETPELLITLKQANVVDAGGSGFVIVIDGMLKAINGEPVLANENDTEKSNASSPEISKKADFSAFDTENIVFPYCTECIVTKSEEYRGEDTAGALYEFIRTIGDSAVFVDDTDIIKLHVHTAAPGRVLTQALLYGSLYSVKVENMQIQHTALASAEKEKAAAQNIPSEEKESEPALNIKPAEAVNRFGFVAVCAGQGICDAFRDMGADNIVIGGQSMNPSTDELISAIKRTPSKTVFVLPNNKNIILVALQAAKMVKCKRVVVMNTSSVPQGIAALFAFNPELDEEENIDEMNNAIQTVTSMSMTYAVRDSVVDSGAVSKGEILGIVDGEIYCTARTKKECMMSLCDRMPGAAVVTLFYGENVSDKEADEMKELISNKLKSDCEITAVFGGQPLYDYIISAEY